MKKTQSLKLMLLGLLALGSTSAWAQYTAEKGVLYGLNDDGKAVVVGILSNIPDGEFGGEKSIQIADAVTIKGNTVKVVDFDANWKAAGEFSNDAEGNLPGATVGTTENADGSVTVTTTQGSGTVSQKVFTTVDATALEATIDLVFRASELTEITKDDIAGLPIAAFVLGGASGITEIPDGLLAAAQVVRVPNADKPVKIAEAEALIDGTTGYLINDGKYEGHQVYEMTHGNNGRQANDRYFYIDETITEEQNGEFVHPAYRFTQPSNAPDFKVQDEDPFYWVHIVGTTAYAWIPQPNGNGPRAWREAGIQFDGNLGAGHIKGTAEKLTDAEDDLEDKTAKAEDARKERAKAEVALDDIDAYNQQQADKRKLAEDLKNAIEVFNDAALKQAAADVLETNVNDITAWTAAFTWVNTPITQNTDAQKKAVDDFVAAYNAFYQKDPEALEGVTITSFKLTQYTVDGELIGDGGTYTGTAAVEFSGESELLVRDGQNDQDAENAAAEDDADGPFYRITVLTGNDQGKHYYIKANPSEIDPEESAYYALYEYDEYDGFILVSESDATVVKFNGTEEYGLVPTGDNAPTIDNCDPYNDYMAVINQYPDATEEDLTEALKEAKKKEKEANAAKNAAQTAYNLAKAADDAAQAKLTAANNLPDYVNEYRYNKDGKNETLVLGAFNNNVVKVGAHAFANCVNAEFTGTFRSNLQKIGAQAFMNTQFKNLDLSETGKSDWRGGEADEDGNPTPDGKIDIQDRLGDADIAADAFSGTPLETMLLATTNLDDETVKDIIQGDAGLNIEPILFEAVNYTIDCDEITRNVNRTLTTVTLPAGIDGLEYTILQNETFQNCVALADITIPAQVTRIEEYAFAGCDALAKISFAATDSKLATIQRYAFYGTAADKLNLTKQTLLTTVGEYAFANMTNLKVVNLTNTKLTTLPATVFDGDALLNRVTFYDATDPKSESTITSLPAGIFKTNVIKNLDLGKTQITVLQNLFQAEPGKEDILDCDDNKIGEKRLENETLQTIILPEELEEIEDFALSSLWGLTYSKADPFIIPSSVKEIGVGAFMNDKNLVAVKAMDSELTALPQSAFAQCSSLEEVTLVTVNTLLPVFFGDKCFFATKNPDVYVNNDTYKLLGENFFEGSYAILKPYASVINTNQIGSLYYKPWTSKYGAWIEATEHVGVYTAYQNGSKISLYPAKKSTFVIDGVRKDYYKIAAYDKDAYDDSRIISEYGAPYQIDYLLNARMTFDRKAQFGENLPSQIPTDGSYIDSYNYYLLISGFNILDEEFDSEDMDEIFSKNFSSEVRAKTWLALGTAIIVSDQAAAIPYLQKTNPWQKYQSTLDLANQLIVATEDIPADNNTNFYYLAEQDGKPKFIHHNDETVLEFIPEEAVAFMMDADFGHMGLSRDFFDIEFISENGATAINGVVERSINDGEAIYNLQGVKVAAPKKGQLYIQGGKTFIQK